MATTHILLATTGASPQVITETLYAIHQEAARWPDEIFLITTRFGKTKAVEGLLDKGHLDRLCQQLGRSRPQFTQGHILVVPGSDGSEVEDARSLADHEALANFIMAKVRNFTADPEISVHASLAGGRKTMTFYIGYAMSLFGRAQDSLTHVLVSEGYENLPGFWFPANDPAHRYLDNRGQTLDASLAQVTLAPIPFIRHRLNLPKILLQQGESVNFAELVQLINLGENPHSLGLTVDLPGRAIRINDRSSKIQLAFAPSLIDLAFFTVLARATLEEETDYKRPGAGQADLGLARSIVDELLLINQKASLGRGLPEDIDLLIDTDQVSQSSLESLRKGATHTWFDTRRNKLQDLLAEQLPESLLRWILPSIIWTDDGQRLALKEGERNPKGGGYGIPLPRGQIVLLEP